MAGSKKDGFETAILNHIFCNAAIAAIGDANGVLGSSTAGSLYIALFMANPTDSAQGTEAAYTNYARVAVARSSGGWTVASGQAVNAAAITFPTCGATGATITGFAICKAGTTGVDDAIYWGELGSSLAVSNGITPEFAAGQLTITED